VSDIDTAAADSLKVLDPKRPIREADIDGARWNVRFVPEADAPDHWNALSECSNIRKILPKILFLTAAGILIGIAYVSDCCSHSRTPI
jgi:hypothetical protein